MLSVEIADTAEKQAKGLMFRKHLDANSGMLFLFKTPQKLAFWGVNTYIPLDIAFVKRSGIIESIKTIHPLSSKAVASNGECTMAVEANLGFFENNRISPGDRINKIVQLNDKEASLSFEKAIKISQYAPLSQVESQPVGAPPWMQQPPLSPPSQPQNLPVINTEQLGEILEDSFDDEGEEEDLLERGVDVTVDPSGEKEIPGDPAPDVPLPEKDYPDFDNVYDAMRWAQEHGETVRIYYRTNSGRDIERDVEPHGQFHAKTTNNDILVTFDQTVGEIRAFIIDNILYYIFMGKEFQPKFILR